MSIWNPEEDQIGAELPPEDMFAGLDPRVADHMRKKQAAEAGVKRANMVADVGGVADSLANIAFGKPTVYQNNWQSMGQAPKMQAGPEVHNDFTSLQKQAEMKLQGAKSDASEAARQAFEQKKAEMMATLAAKKAEEEQRRFDLSYAQKDRDIASQAKSRQAYADSMMGLKRDSLDLQRQKLEADKGVNGQGKPISGELASKLSGYDAAEKIINDLEAEYNDKASSTGSALMSMIPGTDANSYKAGLKPKIQALGTALEGGKLTDADFSKYEAMIPGPGTFPDQKVAMIKALRESLKAKRDAEANTLQGAGYRVPPSASKPASPPQTVIQNGHTYTLNPATGEYE